MKKLVPKTDKVVQRLLDKKKETDDKVKELKLRKELEIKYKVM